MSARKSPLLDVDLRWVRRRLIEEQIIDFMEDMMAQYLLLLYDDPSGWLKLSPKEQKEGIAKYVAWGEKARNAGYLLGSNKLTDDAGKVMHGPKALVTDGPYSETKEVLGGYYMIEAKDYDEAVRRSKDHPHLEHGGTIEVRQIEQLPR